MKKKTPIKKREQLSKAEIVGSTKKRPLTLEQIQKVANKSQEERLKKQQWNSEEAKETSLANLTGAKTVEGKMRSLENLKVQIPKVEELDPDGTYNLKTLEVFSLLTDLEKEYYLSRFENFKDDFEFNNSSDWSLLQRIIMEEIVQGRLYRHQLQFPEKNLSTQLSECAKRHKDALDSLGASRKERLKIKKEDIGEDVASLAKKFEVGRKAKTVFSEKDKYLEEEEELSKSRREFLEEESTEINIKPDELMERMTKKEIEYDG